MEDPNNKENIRSGRQGKIKRLINKYELRELGDELEQKWTAEGEERTSLRDLAHLVNRRLLKTFLDNAGMQVIDAELAAYYRVLVDNDISEGDRTRLRRRLERGGVDIRRVESEFVSRQAVHTYLTKNRCVTYDDQAGDKRRIKLNRIQKLKNRLVAVTENTLESLQGKPGIGISSPRVIVNVHVLCDVCGTRLTVSEIIDRGGCDCPEV